MPFELPTLPYDYGALEPYIDARTIEIHHSKHHAGYIARLNKVLEGRENLRKLSLEEILSDIRIVPEEIRQEVRNQGGGHLNHSLFWHVMGPQRHTGPTGLLRDAISSTFGDFLKFQDRLNSAALERFGSGWAWLCVDSNGRLEIITTPNQDSPIMLGYRPVLGVDLWEHSYYLKYQNRRIDYITGWWNVINWHNVAELYQHCLDRVGKSG